MSYDNNENRGESIFEDSPRTLISNEKQEIQNSKEYIDDLLDNE